VFYKGQEYDEMVDKAVSLGVVENLYACSTPMDQGAVLAIARDVLMAHKVLLVKHLAALMPCVRNVLSDPQMYEHGLTTLDVLLDYCWPVMRRHAPDTMVPMARAWTHCTPQHRNLYAHVYSKLSHVSDIKTSFTHLSELPEFHALRVWID
jgi:hypothetical protein